MTENITLREYVEKQFELRDTRVQAEKEGINYRLEGMNELRDQINQERSEFVRNEVYHQRHEALRNEISLIRSFQLKIAGGMIVLSVIGISNLVRIWGG